MSERAKPDEACRSQEFEPVSDLNECEKAARCVYLVADKPAADDISQKINALVAEVRAARRLRAAVDALSKGKTRRLKYLYEALDAYPEPAKPEQSEEVSDANV